MSRRLTASLLSACLVAAVPAAAGAQTETTDRDMWSAAIRQDAKDVATLGDGFVLVGGKDRKPAGKVWSSPDGVNWSRIRDESLDGAVLRRVTAFGDGAVALGTKGRKLMAWHSPDGETWERTTVDTVDKGVELFPDVLTDGPGGLIAAASLVSQDLIGQRFYGSTDGLTWSQIEPPSQTAPGIFVSLESDDDEYFAIARPLFPPGADLYWRSPDGIAWESFDGPTDGALHDIAIGADGTVVGVGAAVETQVPAVWRSEDLGTWDLVYEAPSDKVTEERLHIAAVGGPGFLVGGSTSACPGQSSRSCPTASILASADGLEWQALGIEDGAPGPLHDTLPQAIATNGATTAIVVWHDDRPMEVWTLPATP